MGEEVESTAVAIDSDQRVEELEEAVERRAPGPVSPPAPTQPAEPSFVSAARDRRSGDWAPFIVVTALLAVPAIRQLERRRT